MIELIGGRQETCTVISFDLIDLQSMVDPLFKMGAMVSDLCLEHL